jgi:signal transduction histidine kinase
VLSLGSGSGIDLPSYLLVGVPLWCMARRSPPGRVAAGAVAAVIGGLIAAVIALQGNVVVHLLTTGPFYSGAWILTADSWSQALSLALAVWLVGMLFLVSGLLGRMRESARLVKEQDAVTRAEAEAARAQNALAAERTRISREMHDIVAHSLSVMIAQADGGRYAAAANPTAALDALEAIARTGRDALSDMRGIVRVLRDGPADQTMELRPAPHVRDLEDLVLQTRQTGLDVTLVRVGQPRYLPPGVGASLQRIAQEALTNALKHAGPNVAVTVTERWLANRIELVVADDGHGASAADDGEGHGIIGMRERAEMLGGTFRAGPAPTGGFLVSAEVPLPPAPNTQKEETR